MITLGVLTLAGLAGYALRPEPATEEAGVAPGPFASERELAEEIADAKETAAARAFAPAGSLDDWMSQSRDAVERVGP